MEERREEWTWKSTSSRRRTGRRSQAGQDDSPWSQATLGRMLGPGKGRPERGEKQGVTQQIVRESRYRCGFCRGVGKIGGTVCPVCKNKGTVSIMNPPAVVCAFCRGTVKHRRGILRRCFTVQNGATDDHPPRAGTGLALVVSHANNKMEQRC